MDANLPKAYIKHQMPGRVRLKIPQMRGNEPYFEHLAEAFADCDAISQIQLNSQAASLLIQHGSNPFSAVAEFAGNANLFILVAEGADELPAVRARASIAAWSSSGVSQLDQKLAQLSEGRFDLRSIFFLGFVGLAAHQAAKGRIMSPASTFLWRAIELLNSKNDKMFAPEIDKTFE